MKKLILIAVVSACVGGVAIYATSRPNQATAYVQPAYVASKQREPFHKPTCKWAQKIYGDNLQTYNSRQEALAAGHKPCRECRP